MLDCYPRRDPLQMFDRAPAPWLLAPVVIFPLPAPRARVRWGRFPDGVEVIYLYDGNDTPRHDMLVLPHLW